MTARVLGTLLLALLVATPALAQTGQINGVITDNTGAVLPGATVKAVEVATGLSRDTVTGADGRYIFTSLRPTTYDITAELQGFRTAQRTIIGYEAMNIIRKGQIVGVGKGDIQGQVRFAEGLFGVAA